MFAEIPLALLIVFLGWVAATVSSRIVAHFPERYGVIDPTLTAFLGQLTHTFVLLASVFLAVEHLGVGIGAVLTVLASAGLAIGLALQDSLANFAAGVLILFNRFFVSGDMITIADHTGYVEDVGLFATTLLTLNNERVITPNSTVTKESIVNHSTLGRRRGEVPIGVAYGADLQIVMQVLVNAAKRCELVLDDPAPTVMLRNFAASSVDFVLLPYSNATDFIPMLHQVRLAVYDDLTAASIDIPFQQIVIHRN